MQLPHGQPSNILITKYNCYIFDDGGLTLLQHSYIDILSGGKIKLSGNVTVQG